MFTPDGVPGEVSLGGLVALDDAALDQAIAGFQEAFTWWRRPDLVSVAAVQGHAIGAGFQLALACDVRVVADDVQLAMREPSLGLVPDLVGTWPLVHAVGYSRALEICLTGRSVGAEEAVATGLAVRRSHPDELRADARALLDTLVVAPHGAPRRPRACSSGLCPADLDEQRAAERTAQIRRLRVLGAMLAGEAPASADAAG